MRFQGCERLDQDMRVRVSRCDDSTNFLVLKGWDGSIGVMIVLIPSLKGDILSRH